MSSEEEEIDFDADTVGGNDYRIRPELELFIDAVYPCVRISFSLLLYLVFYFPTRARGAPLFGDDERELDALTQL